MNENSNISREEPARAGILPRPRWRIILLALLLALAIGSADQEVRAQEPGPQIISSHEMQASVPKDICIGETGSVRVREALILHSQELNSLGQIAWRVAVSRPGITINATSQDSGIAQLLQTSQVTGMDIDSPGWAEFDYSGIYPGKTNFVFKAHDLSISVSVKVLQCKFVVQMVWVHNDIIFHTAGSSGQVLMTRDESGTFTGSGWMHWVYAYVDKTCKQSASASESPVKLTGKLDDAGGQFIVTETFQASTIPSSVSCPGTSAGAERTGTLDPLRFSVSAFGGAFTQSLAGGTATILVIPVDK